MKKIANFFKWLGNDIKDIGVTFAEGDWKTRLSFVIMGFGSFARKLYARGVAFLALEILFIYYMVSFGGGYLAKFATLGDTETHMDPKTFLTVYGDNSFLVLLYGLLTIIFILLFVLLWRMNIRENRQEQLEAAAGKKFPTVKEDLHSLIDQKFHATLHFQ